MLKVPTTLQEAIAQAKTATESALEDGYRRLQVELIIPEIALEAQALAWEFMTIFQSYGGGLKVIFPDSGAAALARRDWGEIPFQVSDLGSRVTDIEAKIAPEDEIFVVVSPSAVEVNQVEKLCNQAGDRPVILLIPQLEDVAIVGIGYAARQLRERFLSTLETCYYFRPLEGAAVLRFHGSPWQVWLQREGEEEYELLAQESQKPIGEALELILAGSRQDGDHPQETVVANKTGGLLKNLQRFLRALSQ